MKKSRIIQLLALVSFLTLPMACTSEDAFIDNPKNGKVTVRVSIAEPEVDTRMSVTDTGTFGTENLELKWEVGDEFTIYNQNNTDVQASFKINDASDISEDGKSATFTAQGTVPDIANGLGVAYFGTHHNMGINYPTVPTTQSANDAAPFGGNKLPMQAGNITIANGVVSDITFTHLAYVLKYSFRLPAGAANPSRINLESDQASLSQAKIAVGQVCFFTLTGYNFGGQAANFDVYIPLFPSPDDGLNNLTLRLIDSGDHDIGTFTALASSTPLQTGKIYSAKIAFESDGTGSLIETSTFDNTVAAMASFDGIDYEGGDGESEATAIEIASAQQLKKLISETQGQGGLAENNFAGKYIKLTTDIHVTADTWTPLGNSSYPFWGNFDGNGHSITGTLNVGNNSGFFGYIYENTNEITIKNLTVAANVVSTGYNIGGVVGSIQMSSSSTVAVTIDNCHFSGNVIGKNYVGGILGKANIDSSLAVIINGCTSRGSVNTDGTGTNDSVGGIVGEFGYNCSMTNCINYAKVTGKHTTTGRVGGLAGAYFKSSITSCTNYGKITGLVSVGGIVGYVNSNSTYTDNVNNSSDISGNSYVGGLVGQSFGTDGGGNTNNSSVPDEGSDGVPYPDNP